MTVRISNRTWAAAVVALETLIDQAWTTPAQRESYRQAIAELRSAHLRADDFDNANESALLQRQAG